MSARPTVALSRLDREVRETLSVHSQQALSRLLTLGLPTPRDDAFRYTNLRLLERRDLRPASPSTATAPDDLPCQASRAVWVNGRLDRESSRPDGRLQCTTGPNEPESLSDAATDRVRLLNAALGAERTTFRVPRGVCADLDLLVFTTDAGGYPAVTVEVEAGAELRLTEYQLGSAETTESVTAAAMDLRLHSGSTVSHTLYQCAGSRSVILGDVRATVGRDATYRHRSAVLGAQLSRLDISVTLAERGASTSLAGLFLADGGREHHLRTWVHHASPDATSEQRFRGVATDRARGSYDGKIVVDAGANGTRSSQSSKNLLLSGEASIETRPQLEINADAVKCSHGTTTGSLDDRMLFYLLSRGIDRETARALLTYAFLGDVLADFPAALRSTVEARLLGRLPSADLIRDFVA